MDEINVPSFTNDRYYEGKEQYEAQHAKKTGISKLKVAKTTVRFLAAGVVLALVVTNPYVQDAVNIVIDKVVGARYWDYNTEIWNWGNINGYICLRSVLFFGLSSFILMYVFNPVAYFLSTKINKKVLIVLSILIIAIIFADEFYNLIITKVFGLRNAIEVYKTYGIKYM